MTSDADRAADDLCDDCPRVGYPTDKTRCIPCPRRVAQAAPEGRGVREAAEDAYERLKRQPKPVDQWAADLARDSVAMGEAEYATTSPPAGDVDPQAALIREHLKEIDERVTPTICPTGKSDGNGGIILTQEGRIHSDDFQALMGYALGGAAIAEDSHPITASAEEAAREWLEQYESRPGVTFTFSCADLHVQSLAALLTRFRGEQWRPIETAPKGCITDSAGIRGASEWFIGRPSKKFAAGNPPYIVIRRRAWPHGDSWRCAGEADYVPDFFDAWAPLPAPPSAPGKETE